jgi:DNA-binding transcriptional ArsR family regulator
MADNSFILVNLKEDKAKELAKVISNDTSRKILDFLTDKEASATDISKGLKVPLPTVHYNLKHLQKAKLVIVEEFHYSEKGREVDHYKLANKFVIIAPATSKMDSLKKKLSRILPVAILIAAGVGFVRFLGNGIFNMKSSLGSMATDTVSNKVVAEQVMRSAPEAVNSCPTCATPNVALWFLAGAVVAIVLYIIVDLILQKFKK